MESCINCDLEILSSAVYSIKIKGILRRSTILTINASILSVEYDFSDTSTFLECLICDQNVLKQFKKSIYTAHLNIISIELV